MLFLAGGREWMSVLIDQMMLEVITDQERRDVPQLQSAYPAPSQESIHGALVGLPGVGVADLRLEEVGVGVLGVGAGLADDVGRGDLAAEPFEFLLADESWGPGFALDDGRQAPDTILILVHDTPVNCPGKW